MKLHFAVRFGLGLMAFIASGVGLAGAAEPRKPNFLLILADDLGYGDAQCYNPDRGKIPTPHIDKLAAQGMRFTDAHSSSSVCSPSRYTLLTGRYHWRSRLQAGIVEKWERPLITADRLTVAGLLQQQGYRTACIGKWHLGWDWPIPPGNASLFGSVASATSQASEKHLIAWREVFSQPIGGGPTAVGFQSYFGTDVPNWPPFCFIENDHTVGIPSEFLPGSLVKGNLASAGGPALVGWKLEGILPMVGDKSCAFLAGAAKEPQPFFLFLSLTAPHTPLAVTEAWRGKSELNPYADWVMETDAVIGRVLAALDHSGAAGNTLVLFTSDNGCAPRVGVKELENKGHFPSGRLRGYKFDAWEGGHREPFIVRWPGVTPTNRVCRQLVHQADLIATFAEIVNAKLPPSAGEDSLSLLPLIKGGSAAVRETAVSCGMNGEAALRKGPWKLIFAPDPSPNAGTNAVSTQLYHLDQDLGEKHNLALEQPTRVAEMSTLMDQLISRGRSTPGPAQKNDTRVTIRKDRLASSKPR